MIDYAVVPERTALVNIDMQNCFVEAADDGVAALDRINWLAELCRDAGILVIHTSHVLRPDGSNMGVLGELVPKIRDGLLNKGAKTAALHPGLVVDPRDVLVEKPRYGAFYGTDLEVVLRSRAIDTVIISGISTDVCCDTTAREANARDFRVLFLSDGTVTAGPDAAEVQRSTMKLVGALFGQVLSVQEVADKIARAR
jgi:ureidoacrylate peracid hydrolase